MTENHTDRTILDLYRNALSRQQGFELLVRTYSEPVYWLVRRMVFTYDDASDVTQEIFIRIWQNLHQFREESKLFTWIYRIASNEALAFLKKSKKHLQISFELFEHEQTSIISGDPGFSGDEIQRRLHQAIQQLPPQQRLIFNMRYFDELKYEEISQILKLSEGALKASYHHAVKKIEKFVTGD